MSLKCATQNFFLQLKCWASHQALVKIILQIVFTRWRTLCPWFVTCNICAGMAVSPPSRRTFTPQAPQYCQNCSYDKQHDRATTPAAVSLGTMYFQHSGISACRTHWNFGAGALHLHRPLHRHTVSHMASSIASLSAMSCGLYAPHPPCATTPCHNGHQTPSSSRHPACPACPACPPDATNRHCSVVPNQHQLYPCGFSIPYGRRGAPPSGPLCTCM